MYICKRCRQTFEKPLQLGVDHEAGNEPVYVCPHCRNFNYSEAVYCTICEEAYPESDHCVNEGVCDECLDRYYNAYIPIVKMLNDKETRQEYMKWQGIPLRMDGAFRAAIDSVEYRSWEEDDRKRFLRNVKEFFLGDKYWFVTKVLTPAIQKYNIGEFKRLYDPQKFIRFVGQMWDPDSTYYLQFTEHFYNVPQATKVMAKALGLYLLNEIADDMHTGKTENYERLKESATEFIRDYPYIGLAYCIFCERSWLP